MTTDSDRYNRLWMSLAAFLIVVLTTAASSAASAASAPSLSLHLMPADFGLSFSEIETLLVDCDGVEANGVSSGQQFAVVIASGVPSLNAVSFGVSYPPSVDVLTWVGRGSPLAIPDAQWPASGGGLALAWDEAPRPFGADSLLVLGYFLVESGSSGIIGITPDARTGQAEYVDEDQLTRPFNVEWLGTGDVAGGLGYSHCGDGGGAAPAGGGESELLALAQLDITDCAIQELLLSSSHLVLGRVAALESGVPWGRPEFEEQRSLWLPASVTLPYLEERASLITEDNFQRIEVDVIRATPPVSSEVSAMMYTGSSYEDRHEMIVADAPQVRVGDAVLLPLVETDDATKYLITNHRLVRRFQEVDAEGIHAIWERIGSHMDKIRSYGEQSTDEVARVTGSLQEIRLTQSRTELVLELHQGSALGATGERMVVDLGRFTDSPVAETELSCESRLQGVVVGATLAVRVCEIAADGHIVPCDGALGVATLRGAGVFLGFREVGR